MRFALVGPFIEENLSVGYLAAALRRAGHQAELVAFADDEQHGAVAERIADSAPDAVGLSMSFQRRAHGFLSLAADLRQAGYRGHITAGGHFASVIADSLLTDHPDLDSVLCGEADESIVALAAGLDGGGNLGAVPGLVARAAGGLIHGPKPHKPCALDGLPPPARDFAPVEQIGIPTAPMLASRGCEGTCTFCSIAAFGRLARGPARRVRSVEAVANEMAALWQQRRARIFIFHDDDFFSGEHAQDRERIAALRAAMAARGLPKVALVVKARPDDLDGPVVAELCAAGLVRMFLGIETHAPAGLRALGRKLAPEATDAALALLARHDVFVCSNLLLWEPDTTLTDLRANIALMQAHPDQLFNLSRTEPYEGAPITRRLQHRGALLGNYLRRDYLVADARAELAWRLFRVALGERCFPMDGIVNSAMAMVCDARLLRHFSPSPVSEQLVEQAAELARRQSMATAGWLERVVRYSAEAPLGRAPEVLFSALDMGRAVRAEDAVLAREIGALRGAIAAAAEPPRVVQIAAGAASARAAHDAARSSSHKLLAAAAAVTVVGCSRTAPSGQNPPASVTVSLGGPATTAPDATATATAEAPDSAAVTLTLSSQGGRWEHCTNGQRRSASFRGDAALRDPKASARFERIELAGGKVSEVYVSPDGRRARFVLGVGKRRGRQRVKAIFRNSAAGSGTLTGSALIYQYGDGQATLGPEAQPEPECGIICDPAAPPADNVLAPGTSVVFTQSGHDPSQGWATTLRFAFGLRDSIKGELAGPPEVRCTTGTVSAPQPHRSGWGGRPRTGQPRVPPLREQHEVTFDPRPADGSGRLQAGVHGCTVRYRLRTGSSQTTVEGKLPLRIEADGTVRLGAARAGKGSLLDAPPAAAPQHVDLPLPLRYGLRVEERGRRGDVVTLEASCPAAYLLGEPSFRWWASAGQITPLDGGTRAHWELEREHANAVAVCSVQARPFDLQVASWRAG